jgi:hypothetical protein
LRNNKLFIIATALSVIFVVLLGIIVFSSVQVVEDVTYDMAAPSPNEASVSTGLISADSSVSSGTAATGDTGISSVENAEEQSDASSKEAAKTDSAAASGADAKADPDASSKKDTKTDADASSMKDTKTDTDASSKKDSKADSDVSSKKDAESNSDASSGKDDKSDSKSSSGKKGKTDSDASSGKDKETAPAAEAATAALSDQEVYAAAQLLRSKNDPAFWAGCPARNVQLLTINPYSRCGDALTTVTTLVIHYVGNAGTSAMDNREYFEDLKDTHITSASSHFIISLDGEIVQCIPLSEVAYASNDRNNDTIAIECCHPEADGKFSDATYASLVELSAFLCKSFHINPQELLRHYDVSGKLCPLYYVEHPDEWQELKDRIEARTDELLAAEEDID